MAGLFNKQGNIKLGGRVYSYSKLFGSEFWYIPRLGFNVQGTCGKYCSGCKEKCYVRVSYRYPSVKLCHAINTLAMRNDIANHFAQLDTQLSKARIKPDGVRINQSGEIETEQEFRMWVMLAARHSTIPFWMYTKAYDIVTKPILELYEKGELPGNLAINISIWHEYGIAEFKALAHIPNIKAFVYLDGFDYSAYGLVITTTCTAYNSKGKLDHNITCTRCKKCFHLCGLYKVIGCFSH